MKKDDFGNEGASVFRVNVNRSCTETMNTEVCIAADSESEAIERALKACESLDNERFEYCGTTSHDEAEIADLDFFDVCYDEDYEDCEDDEDDWNDEDDDYLRLKCRFEPSFGHPEKPSKRSSSKAPRSFDTPVDR